MKTNLFIPAILFIFFSEVVEANITGNDFQNFNPTYSGLDFITVHSSELLEPCILNTSVYYNHAVNTLPFHESVDFTESEYRDRTKYSDSLGTVDLAVGYGINEKWDIGVNIQAIAIQDVESDSQVSSSFSARGLSELRLSTKYKQFGDDSSGLAYVGSININLIRNNFFIGEDPLPTLNFELVYDRKIGAANWATNVGYRLRSPGREVVAGLPPLDDAFIYSTAMSYLYAPWDSKIVGEIYGSYPAVRPPDADFELKSLSNLEALLAIKHDATRQLALVAAAGTEVMTGTASPDWRIALGMTYSLDCCKGKAREEGIQAEDAEIAVQKESLPAPDEVFTLSSVHFAHDEDKIKQEADIEYLDTLAAELKKRGIYRLVVVGHTDSVGSEEYNWKLSERRARSAANYLVSEGGLPKEKLRIQFYGETRPVADNGNYQGRQKNRRVEFEVYYTKPQTSK